MELSEFNNDYLTNLLHTLSSEEIEKNKNIVSGLLEKVDWVAELC